MSLTRRKVTPAMIAASRRNAKKSTGPRTELGKAISSLNAVRRGKPALDRLWWTMINAPVGADVDETAALVLSPAQARHPLFRREVELFREVEYGIGFNDQPAKRRKKRPRLDVLTPASAGTPTCSARLNVVPEGAAGLHLVPGRNRQDAGATMNELGRGVTRVKSYPADEATKCMKTQDRQNVAVPESRQPTENKQVPSIGDKKLPTD